MNKYIKDLADAAARGEPQREPKFKKGEIVYEWSSSLPVRVKIIHIIQAYLPKSDVYDWFYVVDHIFKCEYFNIETVHESLIEEIGK